MSEFIEIKLSQDAKSILQKIEQVITESRHPCVRYVREGVLWENSREYNLTTRDGRDEYQQVCRQFIGYAINLHMDGEREKNNGLLPVTLRMPTNQLNPWLAIDVLIDDLDFQMETIDLVDGIF